MNNSMMNNPMMLLMSMMQRGGNPMQMIHQMARQDPRAAQVMQILGNKPGRQQRDIVMNMARERGVDIDNLARSLGIQIPSER